MDILDDKQDIDELDISTIDNESFNTSFDRPIPFGRTKKYPTYSKKNKKLQILTRPMKPQDYLTYFEKLKQYPYKPLQTLNQRQSTNIARLQRSLKYLAPPVKTIWAEWAATSMLNNWAPQGTASWPQKGNGASQRAGSDIQLKSLEMRYSWSYADSSNTCRMVMVQFTGQNSEGFYPTTPNTLIGSINTVFKADSFGAFSNQPTLQMFNTQTTQQYRVLYDKTFNMGSSWNQAGNDHILITDFPIKKIHFFEDASDANLPSLSEGLIVCYFCSDSTAIPHPKFVATFKLNFTDT